MIELEHLVADLLQDVIEHHLFKIVVGWDVQGCYVPRPEDLTAQNLLWEHHHVLSLLILSQVNDQRLKVLQLDVASGIWVILRPQDGEGLYRFLLDWQIGKITLTEEGVYDDGDEEIEEDLADDDLVEKMESEG